MLVLRHVTSSLNRASIQRHGLDWSHMGAAPGIAGSPRPELEGCFLCVDGEDEFFIRLNNTGGPVDVWEVRGVAAEELARTDSGFAYVARTIPVGDLQLVVTDLPPPEPWAP